MADLLTLRAAVAGDLMFDLSTVLEEPFSNLADDHLVYKHVRSHVGGSAGNLAYAACGKLLELHVLGCVGSDAMGAVVLAHLTGLDAVPHVVTKPEAPTGVAMIVRDLDPASALSLRLLVVNKESANFQVTGRDAEGWATVVKSSDLLFMDGYWLADGERRATALSLMSMAKTSGTRVVLDVVPHRVHEVRKRPWLDEALGHSDIVTIELQTLAGFVTAVDRTRKLSGAYDFPHLVDVLQEEYPGLSWALRFGLGNCSQSLLVRADGNWIMLDTGYAEASDLRAFGEFLVLRELPFFINEAS